MIEIMAHRCVGVQLELNQQYLPPAAQPRDDRGDMMRVRLPGTIDMITDGRIGDVWSIHPYPSTTSNPMASKLQSFQRRQV
jgi:hypothetical protein